MATRSTLPASSVGNVSEDVVTGRLLLIWGVYALKLVHDTAELHEFLHECRRMLCGGQVPQLARGWHESLKSCPVKIEADPFICLLSSAVWITRSGL